MKALYIQPRLASRRTGSGRTIGMLRSPRTSEKGLGTADCCAVLERQQGAPKTVIRGPDDGARKRSFAAIATNVVELRPTPLVAFLLSILRFWYLQNRIPTRLWEDQLFLKLRKLLVKTSSGVLGLFFAIGAFNRRR